MKFARNYQNWRLYLNQVIVLELVLVLTFGVLRANNLRFGHISSDLEYIFVEISWDNAWNLNQGPESHDAIWLFAKYQDENGLWKHLNFDSNELSHQVDSSAGLEIVPAEFGEGLMLKNVQLGARNVESVRLKLNLAQTPNQQGFRFRMFGIEMAYVDEGPFWLGDGGSNFCLRDSNLQPYLVGSEQAIPIGEISADGDNSPDDVIPDEFPKGFGGFYLMKYELGQEQYADFLNTLTLSQQQMRSAANPNSPAGTMAMTTGQANRNAIVISKPAENQIPAIYACENDGLSGHNSPNDGQNRACNWLNWDDLLAYLDWAALRPMTEFEFEKAARGPLMPILGEFAWGTDSVIDANTLVQDGSPSEGVSEQANGLAGLASHGYDGPKGPLRAGFGSSSSSDRLQAGAGYFGHMELSGNLWEMCVPAFGAGVRFEGICGDGELTADGKANSDTWPAEGGFRGGGWNSGILPGFRDLAVSDRFYVGLSSTLRRNTSGGRGCR